MQVNRLEIVKEIDVLCCIFFLKKIIKFYKAINRTRKVLIRLMMALKTHSSQPFLQMDRRSQDRRKISHTEKARQMCVGQTTISFHNTFVTVGPKENSLLSVSPNIVALVWPLPELKSSTPRLFLEASGEDIQDQWREFGDLAIVRECHWLPVSGFHLVRTKFKAQYQG